MTDLNDLTLPELTALRRKMAETANRQMRRLVTAGMESQSRAYKSASSWLNRQGRTRFSTAKNPPAVNEYAETKAGTRRISEKEIEAKQRRREMAEIAQIQHFQNAPTAKIKKIKQQRKEIRQKIKDQTGVELTDEELEDLFEVEAFEWIYLTFGQLGIQAVARAVEEGQSTPDEVRRKINLLRADKTKEQQFDDMTIQQLFEELSLEFKQEYIQNGGASNV